MPINESTNPYVADSDAIKHCKALFLEADRLTDQAYSVLDEPFSSQTMLKFSIAKKCADEKYRQAWQAWLLARKHAQ
ncbi:hypothetical protein [Pseudomonas sp. IAC-BECa141]|uniref:hypothetical protein n=1 Tax=Pseudomonas sp. IAC-BECa141 TaxID=2793103 RepID=UPI001D08829B|nr:hypothetical protein [Pseudomonas sp. IAC-BECa141]UDI95546.1 hypothetical protein I5961_13965 [Pseudomonas sp. IAC-BECa141]